MKLNPLISSAPLYWILTGVCILTAGLIGAVYTQAGVVIQPTPSSGLVAYWTFDLKSINWGSSILSDVSENNNSGTLVNMSAPSNQVAGKKGQALFFNGNDNYITLPSNPLVVADPSTACSWVKTVDITASPGGWNQTFLNLFTDSNNGIRMGTVVNTGSFFASYRSGGTYYGAQTSAPVFSDTIWAHVCYVWSGSGITLYANGISLATTTNTDSAGAANQIGALNNVGDGTWSGSIDDLRVYSRALTATEIRQIYQSGALVLNSLSGNKTATIASTPTNFLASGLVGHWSFDGNKTNWASNTSQDSSGNGNTGTMTNMSTTTSPAQGKIGQGLRFDGVDDVINAGPVDILDNTAELSFGVWVKVNGYGENGQGYIITKANDATSGWRLQKFVTGGSIRFNVDYDGASDLTVTGNVLSSSDFGKWVHFAVTWDGSLTATNVHIYKNGVEISYSAQTDGVGNRVSDASSDLRIGNNSSLNRTADGSIDDVRIYNRVLSATEVKQLYNQGR